MTNKELIERLQRMPAEAEVFVDNTLFSKEKEHEKVSDLYPTNDGTGVVLIGEG